jgi:hypothetical protein
VSLAENLLNLSKAKNANFLETKTESTGRHSKLPEEFALKPSALIARDTMKALPKEKRIQLALANPVIFGEYYIKPYVRKWNSWTADHQFFMLEESMKYRDIVIHVPVEHAKSTWFSLVVPLWLMCRDRNTQGAIISNTSRQAEGFLAAIKWHIEYNDIFREDFGDYVLPNKKEAKWTDSQIFVVRDAEEQSKDPTILAIGTGGALLGARLDWVIADDILDLKNSQTEIMRDKVESWWDEIVDSRVVDGGRRIVLGTLQHTKDLLCVLSDRKSYHYVHLAAWDKDTNATLWPDQWPLRRVMQKKATIGTLKWNKVMQNDRSAISVGILDDKWLNYYDNLPPTNRLKVYIGVDPAIADDRTTAESKAQDKFGLVVVGYDGIRAYLLEEYEEWLTFPEQLKLIDVFNSKWSPIMIGIESVQYQKALAQASLLLSSLPPVLPIPVGTQSKATRIEAFSVYCENKVFWIGRHHERFIEEWRSWEPGGKSPNILDASVIAMMCIKSRGNIEDIQLIPNSIQHVSW